MTGSPFPKGPYGGKESHKTLVNAAALFGIIQSLEKKDVTAADIAIESHARFRIAEAKIDAEQERGLFAGAGKKKQFFISLEDGIGKSIARCTCCNEKFSSWRFHHRLNPTGNGKSRV
jgi:hypothetical protein